jgi:hypothetical protein
MGPVLPVNPVAPILPEVTTPVKNAPLPRIYEPVMLPVTLMSPDTGLSVVITALPLTNSCVPLELTSTLPRYKVLLLR